MAVVVMATIPIVVLYVFFQRYFVEGIAAPGSRADGGRLAAACATALRSRPAHRTLDCHSVAGSCRRTCRAAAVLVARGARRVVAAHRPLALLALPCLALAARPVLAPDGGPHRPGRRTSCSPMPVDGSRGRYAVRCARSRGALDGRGGRGPRGEPASVGLARGTSSGWRSRRSPAGACSRCGIGVRRPGRCWRTRQRAGWPHARVARGAVVRSWNRPGRIVGWALPWPRSSPLGTVARCGPPDGGGRLCCAGDRCVLPAADRSRPPGVPGAGRRACRSWPSMRSDQRVCRGGRRP